MDSSLLGLLQKGAMVKIHPRAPQHPNQRGIVFLVPKHPVTWFKVQLTCGTIGTFRSSNLIPLDPETGNAISLPKQRAAMAETDDDDFDGDDVVVHTASRKRRPKEGPPHAIIKQYPSLGLPTFGSFSASGHCLSCGEAKWAAAKFCWNEICPSSPVFFQLPGCRGFDDSSSVASGARTDCCSVDDSTLSAKDCGECEVGVSRRRATKASRSDSITSSEGTFF